MSAATPPVSAAAVVVSPRTRGTSKTANWRRPEQVAVIALESDLSGDPVMRRRLEKHWAAVFGLRRGVHRDAGAACRAYLAARHERAADPQAVRARLGLTRKAVEDRAKTHVEPPQPGDTLVRHW